MKMSDVKVGMKLHSDMPGALSPITVTKITERGFKYKIDAPRPYIPRWGMTINADGHEHYGYEGETFYEMKFLLCNCDVDTALNRKVRSLATGNTGTVTDVDYSPPYLECMKHCQKHTPTITINWENGNKSMHPLCDYEGVEIIK